MICTKICSKPAFSTVLKIITENHKFSNKTIKCMFQTLVQLEITDGSKNKNKNLTQRTSWSTFQIFILTEFFTLVIILKALKHFFSILVISQSDVIIFNVIRGKYFSCITYRLLFFLLQKSTTIIHYATLRCF